ncbi:MAG: acireductone synthase [Bacteroidota bacterium]
MIRYILTDIEGTTTSTSFVYETLFPYFKRHIAGFLTDSALLPEVATQLQAVQQTVSEEGGPTLSLAELADTMVAWTEADRKHPAFKLLQGILWRDAYKNGQLTGHIYPDVPPALEYWKIEGIQIGVYSSGSVEAQHLLFGFSDFGDLRPYFANYFDTSVGNKREADSYRAIVKILQIPADEILFLSDVEAELDAALMAGIQTVQIVRPGTVASEKHDTAADFSQINLTFK